MKSAISLVVPCRADEPDFRSTLDSLLIASDSHSLPDNCVKELIVCINGGNVEKDCPPLRAVRYFCDANKLRLDEVWLDESRPTIENELTSYDGRVVDQKLRCLVLSAPWRGKPRAMNALFKRSRSNLLVFCDADVRVDPEAIAHLYSEAICKNGPYLIAATEVPDDSASGSLWWRLGALPYRFDFGNVGGRLFLIRKNALRKPLPEDLLLEDAWITVAVGKKHVRKLKSARVFFVPPLTWSDYFAERVRAEGGKIQIKRQYKHLLLAGPVAKYPWMEMLRRVRMREYIHVILILVTRVVARLVAYVRLTRSDFYGLYRPFKSTKDWSTGGRKL